MAWHIREGKMISRQVLPFLDKFWTFAGEVLDPFSRRHFFLSREKIPFSNMPSSQIFTVSSLETNIIVSQKSLFQASMKFTKEIKIILIVLIK